MLTRRTVFSRSWTRLTTLLGGAALLAGLLPLSGCTQMIGNNTPYYKNGPAQREGPHGTIPAGTPVWVLGKEGSYSHVWALNGVDGYVWDSSIVTADEWNRRQAIQKQNEEAERRARAKGMGPLGPPEPGAPPAGPASPAAPPKATTPPRSSGSAQPGK
jgi:hypothetical protein